jgi:hypothetical protein
MKKIVATIPQVGAPKIEAVGFNGVGCEAATAPFEKALSSGVIANREYKDEWANPETTTEEEKQGISW